MVLVKDVILCNYYDYVEKRPVNVVVRYGTGITGFAGYEKRHKKLDCDGSGGFLNYIPHLKLINAATKKPIKNIYANLEASNKNAWDELSQNLEYNKKPIYFGNFTFNDVRKVLELSFLSNPINNGFLNEEGMAIFLDKFLNKPDRDCSFYADSQATILRDPYFWQKVAVGLGLNASDCLDGSQKHREISNSDLGYIELLEKRMRAPKNEPYAIDLICENNELTKRGAVF